MNDNVAVGTLLILLLIVVIIFGPLLTIWALNTLFALAIPYTLSTWFATAVLGSFFTARALK